MIFYCHRSQHSYLYLTESSSVYLSMPYFASGSPHLATFEASVQFFHAKIQRRGMHIDSRKHCKNEEQKEMDPLQENAHLPSCLMFTSSRLVLQLCNFDSSRLTSDTVIYSFYCQSCQCFGERRLHAMRWIQLLHAMHWIQPLFNKLF